MISLCMIAKNEEHYLESCLNSVKSICDEIIIVDTGSTDKTKEIALRFGAKVYDFKWVDDFSAARNESLRHAKSQWILVMDPDEIIGQGDLGKIMELAANSDVDGISFDQRSYIENYFDGAYENKSGLGAVKRYPFFISNHLVRLFRNNLGIHFKHKVHELVEDSMKELGLKYAKSDIIIHHFGSLKEKIQASSKVDMYSRIILNQIALQPENPRYSFQAAKMYLGKGDFANSLKFFDATARLDPGYKLVFSEIAKVYLRMNDKNGAINFFRKSMEQNTENPSPANNLAVVLMSLGRFGEAKIILEKQLGKHPDNRALRQNYQECLKNLH